MNFVKNGEIEHAYNQNSTKFSKLWEDLRPSAPRTSTRGHGLINKERCLKIQKKIEQLKITIITAPIPKVNEPTLKKSIIYALLGIESHIYMLDKEEG